MTFRELSSKFHINFLKASNIFLSSRDLNAESRTHHLKQKREGFFFTLSTIKLIFFIFLPLFCPPSFTFARTTNRSFGPSTIFQRL